MPILVIIDLKAWLQFLLNPVAPPDDRDDERALLAPLLAQGSVPEVLVTRHHKRVGSFWRDKHPMRGPLPFGLCVRFAGRRQAGAGGLLRAVTWSEDPA